LHHHMQTPIMTKTIKTPCFFSSMVILLAKMKTMKNAQTKNKGKYEKDIYIKPSPKSRIFKKNLIFKFK